MRRFQKVVVLLAVGFWTTSALAAEPAIRIFPKPGDVVSADFLSDMFREVKPDLATTLVGTWSTQCWDSGITDATAPGTGTLTVTSLTSISFTGISCMAGTGGVRQLITSPPRDPFYLAASITQIAALGNQAIFVTTADDRDSLIGVAARQRVASILQLEQNQITIAWADTGFSKSGVEVLTRTNKVPSVPTELASSSSALVVTLTWKDNSTDETKFRLLRRDSLTGTFAEVSTPAANATTTTDTVTTAGTYWYRIQATNGNGNSLGSNLVKVTVP